MRLFFAVVIGAIVLDWAYVRFEHHALAEDNRQYKLLLARHERTREAQDNALTSCRIMVDEHVMSRGQATVIAMNTDVGSIRRWRQLRGYERAFPRVAKAIGLVPPEVIYRGILQEAPGREDHLLVGQQEARLTADRRGREN